MRRTPSCIGLALLCSVLADAVSAGPPAALGPREARIFQLVCAQCHLRPALGIPQLGDAAAWRERSARGEASLLANSVDGVGGMPPLGTCGFCSEEDLRLLARFLAGLPLEGEPRE